jgi:hypothetical protein
MLNGNENGKEGRKEGRALEQNKVKDLVFSLSFVNRFYSYVVSSVTNGGCQDLSGTDMITVRRKTSGNKWNNDNGKGYEVKSFGGHKLQTAKQNGLVLNVFTYFGLDGLGNFIEKQVTRRDILGSVVVTRARRWRQCERK